MNEDILILSTYVTISSYRKKVIQNLKEDEVKIPTKLAKDSLIRPNHISKVLKELKEKELVECINEEARKGRLYRLTPLGIEVKKTIDEQNIDENNEGYFI